ncbi:hypothetical protein BSF_34460 [Bacillus subtilis]|nr:hypothetical protein BSF_34460 [Bacillus subtilis]
MYFLITTPPFSRILRLNREAYEFIFVQKEQKDIGLLKLNRLTIKSERQIDG